MNPTYSRLVLPILSTILLVLTACTPWQDPTVDVPSRPKSVLDSLKQVDQQLASITTFKAERQLDSLLVWTVLLKNYAEEAALTYTQEATRIAGRNNQKEYQGLGRYYMALLEGRQQIFREGLADPLVNARICRDLWEELDNHYWAASSYHLLGDLFYRVENYDSAHFYFDLALSEIERQTPVDSSTLSLEGSILHGLGILQASQSEGVLKVVDSLYSEAEKRYQASGDQRGQIALLQSKALLLNEQGAHEAADTILQQAIDRSLLLDDNYFLAGTYQLLGNQHLLSYRENHNLTYFYRSNEAFDAALESQTDNYFYTYRRLARLMQSRANRDSQGEAYVDSALVYYKLAFEAAKEEGALGVFDEISKNISRLCEWLSDEQGRDCRAILGESTYSYLYENYSGVVDIITEDLGQANANYVAFERDYLQAREAERVRNNRLVSAFILAVSLLIFLLLFQQQKQKRLQARMAALRAQINPHFFSNSLNAIESLVNLDQRKAASKYLIHFSRLTRRVLNSSMETATTLAGELETTKHFLALEQLRFKDKLRYEIDIASDIDPHLVKIPSLIFQPYLENAIWHGIKPKDDPSLLQIKISRTARHLLCEIEDDGIGREAAKAQQENTLLQKKSVGMKITKERLQSFGGGTVEVIDLYNENGDPGGTKVLLQLPYKIYKA